MKEKWEQLSERDKSMLLIGSIVVIIYLIYSLVYSPLNNRITQLTKDNHYQAELLAWMKQAKSLNRPPSNKTIKSLNADNLLSTLTQELKRFKLTKYPYQIQQTASGKVRVTFKSLPFDQMMVWLLSLKNHYKITISQLTATKLEKKGFAKAEIVFSL